MLNNALFRVEEVQDKEEERKKEKEKKKEERRKYYDFKHTLASWSGLELARACAKFMFSSSPSCSVAICFHRELFGLRFFRSLAGSFPQMCKFLYDSPVIQLSTCI